MVRCKDAGRGSLFLFFRNDGEEWDQCVVVGQSAIVNSGLWLTDKKSHQLEQLECSVRIFVCTQLSSAESSDGSACAWGFERPSPHQRPKITKTRG